MSILNIKSYLCKQKHIMVEQIGNTGTRATGMLLFGGELTAMIYDMKWMLIAIGLLITADYRLGCEESKMQYRKAVEEGNEVLKERYKFRGSRARRQTANKLIDYLIYMMVGISIGKALLPQLSIDYVWGGWVVAFCIAAFIEIPSSAGHLFYVRGVTVKKKTIAGFTKAFITALAKSKSEDVGNALDEGFKSVKE